MLTTKKRHSGVSSHDQAIWPKPLAAEAPFLFNLTFFHSSNVPLINQKHIVEHPSRCVYRVKQMPIEVNIPNSLSLFFSQATSSVRKPRLGRSFSSVNFFMTSAFSLSRPKPWVGIWWTVTPNRGFTSLVSLPDSANHSALLRAASTDAWSLIRITYPVLVVPISATCTSSVDGTVQQCCPDMCLRFESGEVAAKAVRIIFRVR